MQRKGVAPGHLGASCLFCSSTAEKQPELWFGSERSTAHSPAPEFLSFRGEQVFLALGRSQEAESKPHLY